MYKTSWAREVIKTKCVPCKRGKSNTNTLNIPLLLCGSI